MKKSGTGQSKEKKRKKEDNESVASEGSQEEIYAVSPPNGGWGWFVVFCAFYCNVVIDGIQLSFGVFLETISRDLKADYSQVSLAASVMFGTHLLMGPVCCGFNSAFGLRPVTITGALICSFGIGISYFSPNYWCLCMTFGVIGGIGLGLVYMNTLVITSLYFTTLLPAAIAVVTSGTGAGTMIFAALGNFLLQATTWQNSFLYQAALAGSMSIAAISFKPLKPVRVQITPDTIIAPYPLRQDSAAPEFESYGDRRTLFIKSELPMNESYSSLATVQTAVRGFAESVISGEFISPYFKRRCSKCLQRKHKEEEVIVLPELRPVQTRHSSLKSYMEEVPGNEEISPTKRLLSSVSYKTVFTRIDLPEEKTKPTLWQYLKRPIVRMLDFHLLRSFNFTLFVTVGATELAAFLIVLIYEKDRCEDLGFSKDLSVYFVIAIGASNMFWRLFLGGVAIIPGVRYAILAAIGIILGGIATIFSGFSSNIVFQFAYCFIFAMALGCFAVFRVPFLIEIVGIDRIESATGISLLFMGVLCICAPPFFGWLLSITKSYRPMFISVGSVIAVSGLLHFAVKKVDVQKNMRAVK